MSNLAIEMTGSKSAKISFTANQNGNVLAAGEQVKHEINISDEHFIRRIQGELFKLRESDQDFNVTLKIGDSKRITLDSSLWHDLCDALMAFFMNIDLSDMLEVA